MSQVQWLGGVVLIVMVAVSVGCQGRAESDATPVEGSRVTRLDITSRRPAFGGATFGDVGSYEIVAGIATAVADPEDPSNQGIVDLELAPRTAAGLVESTTVVDESSIGISTRAARGTKRRTLAAAFS